ncbi:MAG: luciferase family protein [Actinomycetota bacterium]
MPFGVWIAAEVGAWPGVSTRAHRFGGVEFRLGRVELGHLHGDHLADLPLPKAIRDEVVASGRARPHHVLPDSGWVSRPIRTEGDARDVVALRSSYERLRARRRASTGA